MNPPSIKQTVVDPRYDHFIMVHLFLNNYQRKSKNRATNVNNVNAKQIYSISNKWLLTLAIVLPLLLLFVHISFKNCVPDRLIVPPQESYSCYSCLRSVIQSSDFFNKSIITCNPFLNLTTKSFVKCLGEITSPHSTDHLNLDVSLENKWSLWAFNLS